jgi:predicted phage baseplate assembly protein
MCGSDGTCTCGCCDGISVETPVRVENRPGLSAVTYRVGRHATFKASMLARLSSAELPALRDLRTRADDDFTIALCDATSVMLDVLTFYQERIANESWLRTATERRSVLELARLIGYQLAPGVASSTHLAFTLQAAPGDPSQSSQPVTIPVGTRVQSVPGPDEAPQTFETVAAAEARAEWNGLAVQTSFRWIPESGDTDLYLSGSAVSLQPGDVILIVGRERLDLPGDNHWDIRVVRTVEPEPDFDRTRVTWGENEGLGLGKPSVATPTQLEPRVYVFRQRAALFGHNAPDPLTISTTGSRIESLFVEDGGALRWADYAIASPFDLDAAYPKVVAGSWIALVSDDGSNPEFALPGFIELCRAESVSYPTRSNFTLNTKVTRVLPDITDTLGQFSLRGTLALAQSEQLLTIDRPLHSPLHGDVVALATRAEGLHEAQWVAVSGKRQRIRVRPGVTNLEITFRDGPPAPLAPGDTVRLAQAPAEMVGDTAQALPPAEFEAALASTTATPLRLAVLDRDGRLGTLDAQSDGVGLARALKEDDVVQEVARIADIADAVTHDRERTTLALAASLRHCYDRATVRINANVAPATHGESVSEIAGSGDASTRDQRFTLRQAPLTYVSAETPDGRASTLEVRVNDLRWQEVPTLYGRPPAEHVFTAQVDETGRATLLFGDGVEGARLPTGTDNVRASYRKGIGVAGNVPARRLTTLLSHPLGVTTSTNPEPATGGADPEALADARDNAPLRVLTLDRAVSIRDYEDYSRGFAGIAKAHAVWIPAGQARGVFITVAGIAGAPVVERGPTHDALVGSLRRFGDPLLPLRIVSYVPVLVRIAADVKVSDEADAKVVLPAVERALRARFDFAARGFGQSISVDEIAAVIHAITGVVGVRVWRLHRGDKAAGDPEFEPRIDPALPIPSVEAAPSPAELLILDDAALVIGEQP